MSDDQSRSDALDRRRFLTVLGATTAGGALALSGCSTDRVQKLVPYLVQSEDQVPGVATWYASTCTECASGCGVHVRTREGRAVKLEGNPDHPVNQGKLCSRGQASLQGLYNPGRIKAPMAARRRRQLRRDHLGRRDRPARGKLGEAGNGWRCSAARAGAPSPTSWPIGPPRSAAGWSATRPSTTSRCGPPTARCSASTSCRRTISPGPSTSSRSAPTSWTPGARSTENQRGFARSHGFADGDVAKFVYAAPRHGPHRPQRRRVAPDHARHRGGARARHGQRAARPGRAARRPAWPPRSPLHPRHGGRRRPACRPSGSSGSRASSRRPGRAWRWPAASARSTRARPSSAPRSTCSTSSPATSARRSSSAPSSPTADGYGRRSAALAQAIDGGQVAVLLVHDANPVYALPKASGLRRPLQQGGVQGVDRRSSSTRPPPQCDLLLPQHHALERWDDLAPARRGLRSLMQPVMEPVFNTRAAGDILLRVSQEGGRRAGQVHRAELGGPPQGPLAGARGRAEGGRRRPASGARRCSAAASSTSAGAAGGGALAARARG